MNTKKILKRCYREGIHARNETPERQSIIQMNVKEWLETIQAKWVVACDTNGSFYSTKRKEILERLPSISRGIPYEIHKEQYRYGWIYFMILLLITFSEFWIVLWTLRPYGLGLEIYLISFVIMSTGMLAIHFFLNKIKESNPSFYHKTKLTITVISLIAILIAGFALAKVRGDLLVTERAIQEENEVVDRADRFYDRTSFAVTASMALIALCLSLIGGVVLHEALPKLIISGNVVRMNERAAGYERRIANAANQLEAANQIVKLGMVEFKRGLYSHSGRGAWLIPLSIFLFFLIPSLSANMYANEKMILYILIDQSRSTLCETSKESQFQKNLEAVPEIIKQTLPGSSIKIIGITDSFGNTSVLLESSLPVKPGNFREKLFKAKHSLISKLNELDISAEYDETDIFGAIFYAAINLRGESGKKSLIILSDMRNSAVVNIESVPVIEDKEILKTENDGLIPDLREVKVYVLGVSPCGKDLKYWKSLEKFWRAYFEKAGAQLECFSAERNWDLVWERDN